MALEAGRITFAQVAALVKAVAGLSPAVASAVEEQVLGKAPDQTAGEFRNAVAKAVQNVDPKTAEAKHALAAEGRRVEMYPSGDGMATILAELPAPDAQTIWLAINAHAHGPGADRDLPVDARRADALTNLCAGALADPDLPKKHGRPTLVQVVVDLPTLLGLADHPGHLHGYGPIPATVARALAGDGTWQRLVIEPVTGHLLDAGTTRYRPNQELTDYVLTRSPVCDFPTCHTPATDCDIDHTIPYPKAEEEGDESQDGEADEAAESREQRRSGGKTSASNCGPRCRRHHRLKTHGGWSVEAAPRRIHHLDQPPRPQLPLTRHRPPPERTLTGPRPPGHETSIAAAPAASNPHACPGPPTTDQADLGPRLGEVSRRLALHPGPVVDPGLSCCLLTPPEGPCALP